MDMRTNGEELFNAWKQYQDRNNYPVHFHSDQTQADVFCKYVPETKTVYLDFEGSIQFFDWIEDFKFWQKSFNYPKFKLHAGALNSYLSIEFDIFDYLHSIDFDNLYIAGHSLGGTVAKCFLFDITYEDCLFDNLQIYCCTFGAYRIGNKKICQFFEDLPKNVRLIEEQHGHEITENWPFRWMGYRDNKNIYQTGKRGLFPSIKDHLAFFGYTEKELQDIFERGHWKC